ncbi:MAG: chorismate mutase [Clostridia bacterium]|nr:chorismate mutase [Clostridia bacterium]
MLKTLEEYRTDLDVLDAELVALLEKRMGISRNIGAAKRAANIPIYQPEREQLILKKVTALVKDSGNGEGVRNVYRTIFAESREIQMQIRD